MATAKAAGKRVLPVTVGMAVGAVLSHQASALIPLGLGLVLVVAQDAVKADLKARGRWERPSGTRNQVWPWVRPLVLVVIAALVVLLVTDVLSYLR